MSESFKEDPIRNRYYFISAFLGMLAGNMFNYSIVILSHHLSEEESFAGLSFFLAYLPFLVFSVPAGYYLDLYPKKIVIGFTQFLSFLASTIPGILYWLGILNQERKELLFIFVILNGISLSFTMPGRFAILGELVPLAKIPKFTILMNIFMLIGFAIAPILSGLVVELYSYGELFGLTGLVYLASSILLFSLQIPHEKSHKHPHKAQAFQETFTLIQKTTLLKESLLTILVAMVAVGPIQVLVPEFSSKILNYSEWKRGWLLGFLGLGLIIGSVSSYQVAKRFSRGKVSLIAIPISAVFLGIFGMLGYASDFQIFHELIAFFSIFSIGYFTGLLLSYIPSIIQESIPNLFRGRVMSIYSLIFLLTPAISGLLFGQISTHFTIVKAIIVAGILNFVLGILGISFFQRLRSER